MKTCSLHHCGFVVDDIDSYESKMIFDEKISRVYDPLQKAELALYTNFSDSYIELISPRDESAYVWAALKAKGNHFHHFCYQIKNEYEMKEIVLNYKFIPILGPLKAVLFNNKTVYFYYTRSKQIVEFLIQD